MRTFLKLVGIGALIIAVSGCGRERGLSGVYEHGTVMTDGMTTQERGPIPTSFREFCANGSVHVSWQQDDRIVGITQKITHGFSEYGEGIPCE